MVDPLGNVRTLSARSGVTVLSVSQYQHDHESLQAILRHSNWRMNWTSSCREAAQFLVSHETSVVISECSVPDGGWKWLLEHLAALPTPPVLIVTCRDADSTLWAEVLNYGAYDVLSKPFDRTEVVRIISLAWLYWKDNTAATAKRAANREQLVRNVA